MKRKENVEFLRRLFVSTDWNEHFYYDETSPSCLRWKRPAANGRVKVGDVVGSVVTKGYYQAKVKDKGITRHVRAHRVVYEMFFGEIPENFVIDHIDRDVTNNRKDNLRAVDNRTNCQNKKKSPLNKSNYNGVHLKSNGRRSWYWCTQWSDINEKRCAKNFSILKHGKDEAYRLACEYRDFIIKELNKQGMQYTEENGLND